jgi:hypothetical protein
MILALYMYEKDDGLTRQSWTQNSVSGEEHLASRGLILITNTKHQQRGVYFVKSWEPLISERTHQIELVHQGWFLHPIRCKQNRERSEEARLPRFVSSTCLPPPPLSRGSPPSSASLPHAATASRTPRRSTNQPHPRGSWREQVCVRVAIFPLWRG